MPSELALSQALLMANELRDLINQTNCLADLNYYLKPASKSESLLVVLILLLLV